MRRSRSHASVPSLVAAAFLALALPPLDAAGLASHGEPPGDTTEPPGDATGSPGEDAPPDGVSPYAVAGELDPEFDPEFLSPSSLSWWSGENDRSTAPGELMSELLREAAALRANPLDLNTALARDLSRVPGLDPSDAAAIVAFRRAHGHLSSVEDLAASPRFPPDLVRGLAPYVTCGPARTAGTAGRGGVGVDVSDAGPAGPEQHESANAFAWSVRARSSWRLKPGDDWAVAGSRDIGRAAASFLRLRARLGEAWQVGCSFERDPWERSVVDHAPFHLSWRGRADERNGYRASCVAGHVVCDWGQGLLMTGGRFTSVASFPRRHDRTRGYDGAGESLSRTGVHLAAGRGAIDVELLGTHTRLDAAIDDDGLVGSIRTSGHHRTESEREGQNALSERCAAARAVLSVSEALTIGCSAVSVEFEPGLAPGDPERQRFRFHGHALDGVSVDLRCSTGGWTLGAEAASTSFGGRAAVASVRVRTGRIQARLGVGHLSREFWMPQCGGLPGASGGTNGTAGWVGAEYSPVRGVRLRVETLLRGRPWRSYHHELPDTRQHTTLGGTARIAGLGTFDLEVRTRNDGPDDGSPDGSTSWRKRLSLRTDGTSPLSITLLTATSESAGTVLGEMTMVSVRWDVGLGASSLLSVGATTVTRAGSVPPTVQYEPALPGEFALRTLNASGARWYIRLKASIFESTGISARFSGGPERGEYAFGVSLDVKG